MRQSPTKVVFNYAASQSQQKNMYQTKIIPSGFIVGEPVAYTDSSKLPQVYQSFSPNRSRPRATTDLVTSRRGDYEAPEPSRFAPPPHRPSYSQYSPPPGPKTVSQQQYNRLLNLYNSLNQNFRQLQRKYTDLQTRSNSKVSHSRSLDQIDILPLIQRYKSNLLDEFRLLMDRVRLQEKQAQLQSSRRR